MSANSIAHANNELVLMRKNISHELDLGIRNSTSAFDRPAIFIEKKYDDYNDFTTLLNN